MIREKITEHLKSHDVIYFDTEKISSSSEINATSTSTSEVDDKKSARDVNKIIDMATRIKNQFANAYVTEDGRYIFYANHNGVVIKPDAPKYNPTFYIVNKDLITWRISLDIMFQEVIPQNFFVEVTKEDIDKARRIAKISGAAALKYLEQSVF